MRPAGWVGTEVTHEVRRNCVKCPRVMERLVPRLGLEEGSGPLGGSGLGRARHRGGGRKGMCS